MPDAITQAVTQWRESLRNVQREYIALSDRTKDFVGFLVEFPTPRPRPIPKDDPPDGILAAAVFFEHPHRMYVDGVPKPPSPFAKMCWGEGVLYLYGDADGYREWRDISESMIPLLKCAPHGVTWPEQTATVTSTTWLSTLLNTTTLDRHAARQKGGTGFFGKLTVSIGRRC